MRTPEQSGNETDIEVGVLGCLLVEQDPGIVEAAMESYQRYGLCTAWFMSKRNAKVWEACLEEWREKRAVDPILVARRMGEDRSAVLDVVEAGMGVIGTHAGYYADAMKCRQAYRLAHRAAMEFSREITPNTVGGMVETFVKQLTEIRDFIAGGGETLRDVGSFLEDSICMKRWLSEERFVNKNWDSFDGVPLPWGIFNSVYAGLKPGLHIVAALPSQGKTTMAVNFSYYWIRMGIKHGFVCIDMPAEGLADRYACLSGQLSLSKLNFGASKSYVDEFERHFRSFAGEDVVGITEEDAIGRIEYEITRGVKTKGWQTAIIDYLQLVDPELAGSTAPYIKVMEATKAIKRLAKKLKIPIVCLVQLSNQFAKDVRSGTSKVPGLDHLGDSSEIGRAAASVAVLVQDEEVVSYWKENPPIQLAYGDPNHALGKVGGVDPETVRRFETGQKSLAVDGIRPIKYCIIKQQQGGKAVIPMLMFSRYFMFRPGDYEASPKAVAYGEKREKVKMVDYDCFARIRDDWMYNDGDEILELTGGIGLRWTRFPGETTEQFTERIIRERELHHSMSGRHEGWLLGFPPKWYDHVDQALDAVRERYQRSHRDRIARMAALRRSVRGEAVG
jgi:replicative DNA helicase